MLRTCLISHLKSRQINKILQACISTTETNEKWHLLSAVCLERKPVISPLLNDIETQFENYLAQVELEKSLKSNHEIRHEKDLAQAALLKNADARDVDLDVSSIQTAQDFKDACTEELAKFQFASRETDADRMNDKQSLERKLDRHLVLLTQQMIGNKSFFLPPQGIRQDGETMKQVAERVVKETCGPEMKIQLFGNAPIGFYKYRYPKMVQQDGIVGAKVFIYFARYLQGQVGTKIKWQWVDREELEKEMPQDYYKCFAKCLIDEVHLNIHKKQAAVLQ